MKFESYNQSRIFFTKNNNANVTIINNKFTGYQLLNLFFKIWQYDFVCFPNNFMINVKISMNQFPFLIFNP